MAASDENVKLLKLLQVQNQEGPCTGAFRTGIPVVNADLRHAADRWPLFAPRAGAATAGSSCSGAARRQERASRPTRQWVNPYPPHLACRGYPSSPTSFW
ncbi:hypothetical protein F4553_001923 [Allocatelliglobosispora scoriae]|uniref:Uncharacterized protein n=1 Tax=Allocatelliglobosispora scoriae TaxID=643052 RepID=A0A841BJV0_9ACTN|nr:hypothetical protein [Allocatelliglobosispora scoriae]